MVKIMLESVQMMLFRSEGRQAGCLGIPQNHWTLSTTGFPCFFNNSRYTGLEFRRKADENLGRIVVGALLVGLNVGMDQTLDIAGGHCIAFFDRGTSTHLTRNSRFQLSHLRDPKDASYCTAAPGDCLRIKSCDSQVNRFRSFGRVDCMLVIFRRIASLM